MLYGEEARHSVYSEAVIQIDRSRSVNRYGSHDQRRPLLLLQDLMERSVSASRTEARRITGRTGSRDVMRWWH